MQENSEQFSVKQLLGNAIPTKNIPRLLSLGFGIILLSWLVAQLEWSTTVDIIRNVPPSYLLLGGLCYITSFYLRALRFRLLLPLERNVRHLFPIVLVHYTALNIIPARLGELSYVYLLKKFNHISTGYSVSSLIIARVFDLIAISLLFLLSSLFVDLPSPWLQTVNLSVGGFLLGVIVILMLILAYKERCVEWLKVRMSAKGWNRYTLVQRVLNGLDEIVSALQSLRMRRRHPGKVFGLSLLIWLSIFSVNYLLLRAFEVNLSFIEIALVSTFIILLTVLPFQMMNGLGIHETTWTFIALSLGVPKHIAIVSAFGTHILSTLFLLIFAAYGFWKISHIPQEPSRG